jgi:DNA replication protein DnaC
MYKHQAAREQHQAQSLGALLAASGHQHQGDHQAPAPKELYWTCPTCGTIEPLYVPYGRKWVKRSCECQRREWARREQETIQIAVRREQERRKQRQTRAAREQEYSMYGAWLGKEWVHDRIVNELVSKTFENYKRTRQPKAYQIAYAYACNPQGNLLFFGDYGTGKTHLEAAILNYRREQGYRGLFTTAPDFFTAYNNAMHIEGAGDHYSLVSRAISTPLLVIDDLDKAHPTDTRYDVYYQIFDGRFKAQLPTIVSTNAIDIERYIGKAAYSRLSIGLQQIAMYGDDYRQLL